MSELEQTPLPPLRPEVVAIVGLGYVGLPLALALAKHYRVIGFDIDPVRIAAYRNGEDPRREVSEPQLRASTAEFTHDPEALREATIVIVAVPTPIDATRRPDLGALRDATAMVGRHLKPGAVVVYESTVYPGLTEQVCAPELEAASGLKYGVDFSLGYSPERINPGDVSHSLSTVVKVVAASDAATLERIDEMYRRVVTAGTHRAPSIAVAEASKVLENTQRDLNIALMNELSLIFARAGIDTQAVIDAAATKWNFVPYRPGLVGGHCIGVDPYYLTHLAESLGYRPEVILAGRRVNDSMGLFVGRAAVKELIAAGKNVAQARVAVLGVTFKENVADIRNSRVAEIVSELAEYGIEVVLCDPHADPADVESVYGAPLTDLATLRNLDGIIVTVGHDEYRSVSVSGLRERCRHNPILLDVRSVYDPDAAVLAGFRYWRL